MVKNTLSKYRTGDIYAWGMDRECKFKNVLNGFAH